MIKIPQYTPSINTRDTIDALSSYLLSNPWLTEFDKTKLFELEIAKFIGSKHCIVVNNGTISLSIALSVLGILSGDEVMVPDLTMIATVNAMRFIGARPIFVDVDKDTLCLDVNKTIERWIMHDISHFKSIKAIIYVALNGRCNKDIKKLRNFCDFNKVKLIIDAAQAFGSEYDEKSISLYGHIGSYSFSPQKTITTGQGGALVTDDDDIAKKIRCFKDFGREVSGSDDHKYFGINSKFTDIQAVIGLEQMKNIKERVSKKRCIYDMYYDRLSLIQGIWMFNRRLGETPWFVDIYSENINELATYLESVGIGTRKVYIPLHRQPCYAEKRNFSTAEHFSSQGLWLPSSLTLSESNINDICNIIKDFMEKKWIAQLIKL